MAEYIEREAALKVARGYCHPSNIAKEIEAIPTADVRPVVRGQWKLRKLTESEKGSECSVCHTTWDVPSRYCPFCGAKMVG